MSRAKDAAITVGTTNVFEDLGLPDAAERQMAKYHLQFWRNYGPAAQAVLVDGIYQLVMTSGAVWRNSSRQC